APTPGHDSARPHRQSRRYRQCSPLSCVGRGGVHPGDGACCRWRCSRIGRRSTGSSPLRPQFPAMTQQYLKDFSLARRPFRMQHLFRSSMPRNLEVPTQARARDEGSTITGQLVALFAAAVGIIILNVFAPQILVGLIAPELGLGTAAAGLVAMMTVLGYAAGLLLLLPLADRIESRRLVLYLLLIAVAAAATVPLMPNALDFLADLFVLGAASSVA